MGAEKKAEEKAGPRERRLIRLFIVIPVLLTLALMAYGYLTREAVPEGETRAPLQVGDTAPLFSYPSLSGEQISLEDFRGKKLVLINVWATWCPACREEMPRLETLYRAMKGEDFVILAVSIDALGAQVVEPFVKRLGLTYPILLDPKQTVKKLYRTTGVPESFLVDKGGRLVHKVIGPEEWDRPTIIASLRRLANKGEKLSRAKPSASQKGSGESGLKATPERPRAAGK